MPEPPAFTPIVTDHDGYVRVELTGELDLGGIELLDRTVRPLTGRYDGSQITFDCSRLSFIDVRGMTALLRIARITRTSGRIVLADPPPLLTRMLDLTGNDDTFDLVGSGTAVG
jgi:anti-anti-sigma factor